MRSLAKVLLDDCGVSFPGWRFVSAYDISDDGRVIVGYGSSPSALNTALWSSSLSRDLSQLAPAASSC
jgi:hypothetical protein